VENFKGDHSDSPLGDFREPFFLAKRRPKGDFFMIKRRLLPILNFSFVDSNKFLKAKIDTGHDIFWID